MFRKFIFLVFLILIFCLGLSSIFPQESGQRFFYQAIWFKLLWVLLAWGLVINTISFLRRKFFAFALIYLGFLFIFAAGLLTAFFAEEGFIEIKEGQAVDTFWINDQRARPLNFTLALKDFSVEFYPEQLKGMRFVKSYKSAVTIQQKGKVVGEGLIEVNNPLDFSGYSFYQYGYDERFPQQTILQVVKDPGLPLVYAGYLILLSGMFFSFKRVWKAI